MFSFASCRNGDRQHAANRLNRAVERELSEQYDASIWRGSMTPVAARIPSAIGKVVRSPGLPNIGGRKVDRDAMAREIHIRSCESRSSNAVATLAHARVGQTDHREDRKTKGDIDFDHNGEGLDAEDRRTSKAGQHARWPCKFLSRSSTVERMKTR